MNPKKILIWETQPIIALDIKRILQKSGFEPRVINPSEDIALLISNEKPGLFLLCTDLDFEMVSNLISILRKLKIAIIILSTVSNNMLNKHVDITGIKFLLKPFDEKELINSVHDCIRKRHKSGGSDFGNIQFSRRIVKYPGNIFNLN